MAFLPLPLALSQRCLGALQSPSSGGIHPAHSKAYIPCLDDAVSSYSLLQPEGFVPSDMNCKLAIHEEIVSERK